MKRDLSEYIQQWPESGLSQTAFCLKHKLPYHTFQYYLRRSRSITKRKSKGFIELIEKPSSPSGHLMELQFSNGTRLIFSTMPDIAWIKSLLS